MRARLIPGARCSGDNTLSAGSKAVGAVTAEQGEDYFVFLISDANLAAYGVSSEMLATALMQDARVHSYIVRLALG